MNTDTLRAIEEIKKRGYWRQSQTLGEGGWRVVYSFASRWNRYTLYNLDDHTDMPVEEITARDDETAIKAFQSLYRLGEFAHEIYKVEVKHTLILEQL